MISTHASYDDQHLLCNRKTCGKIPQIPTTKALCDYVVKCVELFRLGCNWSMTHLENICESFWGRDPSAQKHLSQTSACFERKPQGEKTELNVA